MFYVHAELYISHRVLQLIFKGILFSRLLHPKIFFKQKRNIFKNCWSCIICPLLVTEYPHGRILFSQAIDTRVSM